MLVIEPRFLPEWKLSYDIFPKKYFWTVAKNVHTCTIATVGQTCKCATLAHNLCNFCLPASVLAHVYTVTQYPYTFLHVLRTALQNNCSRRAQVCCYCLNKYWTRVNGRCFRSMISYMALHVYTVRKPLWTFYSRVQVLYTRFEIVLCFHNLGDTRMQYPTT